MAIGDSTRINTNIAAFNALNALKNINRNLERSKLKLATKLRINEVADDPAGFFISKRLTHGVKGCRSLWTMSARQRTYSRSPRGGAVEHFLHPYTDEGAGHAGSFRYTRRRGADSDQVRTYRTHIGDRRHRLRNTVQFRCPDRRYLYR